jgi:hypothetical protein
MPLLTHAHKRATHGGAEKGTGELVMRASGELPSVIFTHKAYALSSPDFSPLHASTISEVRGIRLNARSIRVDFAS